jgi:hypothetical protein
MTDASGSDDATGNKSWRDDTSGRSYSQQSVEVESCAGIIRSNCHLWCLRLRILVHVLHTVWAHKSEGVSYSLPVSIK